MWSTTAVFPSFTVRRLIPLTVSFTVYNSSTLTISHLVAIIVTWRTTSSVSFLSAISAIRHLMLVTSFWFNNSCPPMFITATRRATPMAPLLLTLSLIMLSWYFFNSVLRGWLAIIPVHLASSCTRSTFSVGFPKWTLLSVRHRSTSIYCQRSAAITSNITIVAKSLWTVSSAALIRTVGGIHFSSIYLFCDSDIILVTC